MERVSLALVGCGGMAGAHVKGLEELWRAGVRDIQAVACCDVVKERAKEIVKFQRRRPAVYTDVDQMLKRSKSGGLEGYRSQALCMAVFESSHCNRPVSLDEVERGDLEGYQAEIDRSLGIL